MQPAAPRTTPPSPKPRVTRSDRQRTALGRLSFPGGTGEGVVLRRPVEVRVSRIRFSFAWVAGVAMSLAGPTPVVTIGGWYGKIGAGTRPRPPRRPGVTL